MDATVRYNSLNYSGQVVEMGIKTVLKQFVKVEKEDGVTYQYLIPSLKSPWLIVVHPSNEARADIVDNGKAIKFQLLSGKNKVIKQGRIQRKVGWEMKLSSKVRELIAEAHKLVCPHCKNDLTYKSGPLGVFLGCEGYPNCNYTKPLKNAKRNYN